MSSSIEEQTRLPAGPKPLPYIGNVLEFRRDQLGYLEWLQRIYGDMATVYLGTTPVVMLFKPEHVRYILTENPRNFTSREAAFGLLDLIGDGLLTIDGEAHRQQRRLVQPAFHKKRGLPHFPCFLMQPSKPFGARGESHCGHTWSA